MSTPNDAPGPETEPDSDADPGQLNPRDLRDVPSEDGVRDDQGADADADPEQLNPRGE